MATVSLDRNAVTDVLANMVSLDQNTIVADGKGTALPIDPAMEPEIQTDKKTVKIVPCRECQRPLVVTTFFAPAKAICAVCKGESPGTGVATVGQPKPGDTDPAKAVDLSKCLINPHFAIAVCPVHPDDPEHEMELKSVNHNDSVGPGFWAGQVWKQTAKGETVMHQCNACNAVVTFSTAATHNFRRQNEVHPGKHANRWADINGTRTEDEVAAA